MMDPYILRSENERLENEVRLITNDLLAARASAMRWEHEVHSLRKEIQRMRMEMDTERISKE
jgi:hypothetical protein